MSEPSEVSGSAKKSDSSKLIQPNNELEKRLAFEISRITAKKSSPNLGKLMFNYVNMPYSESSEIQYRGFE